MALRTVEPKKRTLHTQNKQIRRSSVSRGISSGSTPEQTDGQMPKASGRFFIPEDNQGGQPSNDGEIKAGKRRTSGKVLHTAARSGMDAVNNHVEGGEELRESEEILMALGAAGKRVFRTRKQKQMNRAGVSKEPGTSSGVSRRTTSHETSTASDKVKDKHLKNSKEKKRLRKKQRADSKKKRYRRYLRKRRKRYEDEDEDKEATPIGIKERLIHGLRVRDSEEDSADNLGSVTKGTKGLKRVIKIILFLIKKLITLLMTPFIIVIVVIVILVALIVGIFMMIIYCSPLSIFFPLPDTGTDDIRMVLSSYYQEFNQKVAEYEADGMKVTYQNTQDGVVTVNFKDTLMVYMTLYSDGQPGYVMDDNGKANLRKVFNEMNYIERASSEHEVKVGESLGKLYVTAYCPCKECSGPHGHATASGKKAKEGRTVAVDA